MRILVTGGLGFIGSHLVEMLVSMGHSVVVWDAMYGYSKYDNLQIVKSLVGEENVLVGDIRGGHPKGCFGTVIHLAALAGVRPSMVDPMSYIETNILGTQCILGLIEGWGNPNLVFASSSSVYGDHREGPFKEVDRLAPPESVYAETKLAGENLCRILQKTLGVGVHCLRFFTAYGPRQRPDLAIRKFVEQVCCGEELQVYGDQTMRDYTYVADIVRGICLSIELLKGHKGFEVINLGAGAPIKILDLIGHIEKAVGVEAKVRVLGRQAGDVTVTHADISKARTLLGYEPKVDFEQGLAEFVKWFRGFRG